MTTPYKIDEALDLQLERVIDVPPELVWMAWTQPEHLKKWFCPKPWETIEAEMDVKPGGIFRTVMRGPDGTTFPNIGCYLEVVPNKRLSWTDALTAGFRPVEKVESCGLGCAMTAILELEPHGKGGTKYRAIALHATPDGKKKHAEMGFQEGWGKALEQLIEHVKTIKR